MLRSTDEISQLDEDSLREIREHVNQTLAERGGSH